MSIWLDTLGGMVFHRLDSYDILGLDIPTASSLLITEILQINNILIQS